MKRKALSREDLHARLQEEYAKTAGDLCLGCRLPLPAYFAGAREGPNWRLPSMADCSGLCHTIAADIAIRVGEKYDLLP